MKKRRKKNRKIRRKLSYGVLAVALILWFSIVYSSQHPSNSSNKVAIVDHLSLSAPNQTFVDASITILKNAGYTVDYYEGEEVTVDFYRDLATHGYVLIVLRVHAALYKGFSPPLALFTSEPYSKMTYINEQLTDQISRVGFYTDNQSAYFGIYPNFIRRSMNGGFDDATIIMMGCDGLTQLRNGLSYTGMAEAFIEKGAKVYISWSGSVLGSHTDYATIHLLQHLITQKQTVKDAVTATMEEVGPDPQYKSQLLCYPGQLGEVRESG